ncbi:hypothetical protein DXG01_013024 [Tephrocybe rancida]|nr:hypothetical protein DXG01_013024 [Tephrocybe rancida]
MKDPCDIDLIPGYLVRLVRTNVKYASLAIWKTQSLIGNRQTTSASMVQSLSDLPAMETDAVHISGIQGFPTFRLFTHASPILANASQLCIIVSSLDVPQHAEACTYFRRYLVSHPEDGPISIQHRCTWKKSTDYKIHSLGDTSVISYSGLMGTSYRPVLFSISDEGLFQKTLEMPDCKEILFISPHSGAIVYNTRAGNLIINYYH